MLKDEATVVLTGWVAYAPGDDTGTGFCKQAADMTLVAHISYDTAKTRVVQQLKEAAESAETILWKAAGCVPTEDKCFGIYAVVFPCIGENRETCGATRFWCLQGRVATRGCSTCFGLVVGL